MTESFPALDALPFLRAAFIPRSPGVDVFTDRETALARLWQIHRDIADANGFAGMPFATAEQVHGALVERVGWRATSGHAQNAPGGRVSPAPAADGLVTDTPGLCLAIYVADCAPVYLADRKGRAIGLIHSGRKGTELGIVPAAIEKMRREFGCAPADLVIQIGPCIRPPHYEVDIASEIRRQAQAAGAEIHDSGRCTASDPERYYSYRREKGQTGRMLALLALKA